MVFPNFRGTSTLDRGVLKRKSGRNTILHLTADSGNIELMLCTINSASQLSVYGAVSSCCMDLAEKMHGQTSTGVDRSISEDIDQLTKQLDPQELRTLVRNQPKTRGILVNLLARSLATTRNDESRWTTSHRTWRSSIHNNSLETNVLQNRWGREWWMWNLIASCRE